MSLIKQFKKTYLSDEASSAIFHDQCKLLCKKLTGLIFVVSILLFISACSNDTKYVTRNVTWGMSKEQVIDNEKKLEDSNEGLQGNNNTYMYSEANMFSLP